MNSVLLLFLACQQSKDSASNSEDSGQQAPSEERLMESVLSVGPYSVGYRTGTHSFTDPLGETVEFSTNIWYPSDETDGDNPTYYNIQPDEVSLIDVELANPPRENGFPLMVFSHGSFLYGASSSFLPRHFASHGWVVIAPDHPNHLLEHFNDGVNISVHYHRPLTNASCIDAIDSIPEWSGLVDTDQALLSGFSFGGYDSWVSVQSTLNPQAFADACEANSLVGDCSDAQVALFEEGFTEPRFKGIIPIAGSSQLDKFQEGGRDNLGLPVFQISGTEDQDQPDDVFQSTTGTPFHWLSITGGCHAMFSVGGCPNIETQMGYDMVSSYSLAFARQVILGDSSEEHCS